jgi:hypothetical protein
MMGLETTTVCTEGIESQQHGIISNLASIVGIMFK